MGKHGRRAARGKVQASKGVKKAPRPGKMTPNLQMRLMLNGKAGATKDEMQAYYSSKHWTEKRKEARAAWAELLGFDGCILCGRSAGLQVHHTPEAYKWLFREDPIRHLRVICARDHKNHERGR